MAASTTIRDAVVQIAVEDLVSHLATLEAELSQGRSIELLRGETVIAEMRAPKQISAMLSPDDRPFPDIVARLKAIYGDEVLPEGTGTKWIRDDRNGIEEALPEVAAKPIPDFRAQMREVFGDKVLDVDTTSWIREDRDGGA